MASDRKKGERAHAATPRTRPLIAVEDDALREQITAMLGTSDVDVEILAPGVDPLAAHEEGAVDLLILRRSSLRPYDLQRFDEYTRKTSNPDLVVLTDGADDLERTRLLSAGVSGILESRDSPSELRDTVAAIAGADAPLRAPQRGVSSGARLADFQSRSPRMRRFLHLVDRVVSTDSSLLITGETGVGKERLAQAIHNEGTRADGPFVSVNCGALPEALLESELFGHEAGAFTGAERRKKGRFELAEGGTIFLDEIGEVPLHLQVTLLSVLQNHRVIRVGGEEPIAIDVRVMAATNRDLVEEIAEGRFREDLFYRLNVVDLEIPPLRERSEDVPDLVGSFISHFRTALRREDVDGISSDALDALVAYSWPGNVRQLVNAVEHAIVVCNRSQISVGDLPEAIRREVLDRDDEAPADEAPAGRPTTTSVDLLADLPLREAREQVVAEFERAYLDELLRRTEGRVGRTAELAGITPRSLYDKLKRHGLDKADYR